MFRKILSGFGLFALVVFLFSLPVRAETNGWVPLAVESSLDFGTHRTERLSFGVPVIGVVSLADAVFIRGRETSFLIRNRERKEVKDIPTSALNPWMFANNGSRIVYTVSDSASAGTVSLVELNPKEGIEAELLKHVYLGGKNLTAVVDGKAYAFNPEYQASGAYRQAGVKIWNKASGQAEVILRPWESKTLRREEVQDISGNLVLYKMIFESGQEELWIGDAAELTTTAVRGSWIEPDGDIEAPHFLKDGTVEFFKNFVRYTYHPATDAEAVRHEKDVLNWYRPATDSIQISGNRMAWLDPNDRLFVSEGSEVKEIGTAAGGKFLLQEARIFYASGEKGIAYDFASKISTPISFSVSDAIGEHAVGLDKAGNVWYADLSTGKSLKLGFGAFPVISDATHVYWQGVDGQAYGATISPAAQTSVMPARAIKSSLAKTVHLLKNGARYSIPDESVYFSWFSSWTSVELMSEGDILSIPSGGTALFAPGTTVKAQDSPDVFLVGKDSKLHWIPSQPVAIRVLGPNWKKGIVTVAPKMLFDYVMGDFIQTEKDAATF